MASNSAAACCDTLRGLRANVFTTAPAFMVPERAVSACQIALHADRSRCQAMHVECLSSLNCTQSATAAEARATDKMGSGFKLLFERILRAS